MKRHAFLVLAHDDYQLLRALCLLIDDARADIYIHVDRRAPAIPDDLLKGITESRVTFVERLPTRWSGYSLVNAEMSLITAAARGVYDYYHLISGRDLPVRSNDDFYSFFENAGEQEFIDCWATPENGRFTRTYQRRVSTYTIFEPPHRNAIAVRAINKLSATLQRALRIDRTRGAEVEFVYGSQWFSVTHSFVEHLLRNADLVHTLFRFTRSPDELFVQTLAWNSPFRERLHHPGDDPRVLANLRFVDWTRLGEHKYSPYLLRSGDIDALLTTDALFARKFSSTIDRDAVLTLANRIAPKKRLSDNL